MVWRRTGISWDLTWRKTGSISFDSGLYGGRKSRSIPAAARRSRAGRTTRLVGRLALSRTTARGTFARGNAPTNPSRSYEPHVRSAVKASSRGGPP